MLKMPNKRELKNRLHVCSRMDKFMLSEEPEHNTAKLLSNIMRITLLVLTLALYLMNFNK